MAKRKPRLPKPAPKRKTAKFDPRNLDKTIIALPLLQAIATEKAKTKHEVIIDLNLDYHGGRAAAKKRVISLIAEITHAGKAGREAVHVAKSKFTPQYVFASLYGDEILELVHRDSVEADSAALAGRKAFSLRAIFRVWPDFPLETLANKSIATVKADAAHRSFDALGAGIVWAVIDSGIDGTHPHFALRETLVKLPEPLDHLNFSSGEGEDAKPLVDNLGHGTHVAGIIAGECDPKHLRAVLRRRQKDKSVTYDSVPLERISGMAPRSKLISLKVLDGEGRGNVSNIIAALAQIQEWNSHGRRVMVHGVNLSVGYGFDAEWFACGQSPLCVEVDRLVKSGVVVVVAAGNTGYGTVTSDDRGDVKAGMGLSINDPGNADLAITVGATHREMPHLYGVSYFSSKGPTGDGRIKPDLVAPGEKILSCAAGRNLLDARAELGDEERIDYIEESGTSMAAPHVSGVIAAFLSLRQEFISRPEVVKQIFLSTATDLKRERYFQGHGLVDLMRAIQSV